MKGESRTQRRKRTTHERWAAKQVIKERKLAASKAADWNELTDQAISKVIDSMTQGITRMAAQMATATTSLAAVASKLYNKLDDTGGSEGVGARQSDQGEGEVAKDPVE